MRCTPTTPVAGAATEPIFLRLRCDRQGFSSVVYRRQRLTSSHSSPARGRPRPPAHAGVWSGRVEDFEHSRDRGRDRRSQTSPGFRDEVGLVAGAVRRFHRQPGAGHFRLPRTGLSRVQAVMFAYESGFVSPGSHRQSST